MAKSLEWAWDLPQGQRISARYEPSSRVESVYLEKRLVSRSTPQGKKDAHVVPLGMGAGAYRGAAEARLVFEIPEKGTALCKLSVDGQLVAPSSMPPMKKVIVVGSMGALLFGIFRIAVMFLFPHHRYTSPPVQTAAPAVVETPHGFAIDVIDVPASGALIVQQLQPEVDRCYRPRISGRAVIEVELASVTPEHRQRARVVEGGGLPADVSSCLASAAVHGRYDGIAPSSFRIAVEYVP